jgi:hypothetical protein
MKIVNSYRVVEDSDLGFEVQVKVWWLPFWFEMVEKGYGSNTHPTLTEAISFIRCTSWLRLRFLNIETNDRVIKWEYTGKRKNV